MKKLIAIALLGLALVAPRQSAAWVAVARGGYCGACWHRGWSCGGVCTGTVVAPGAVVLATGAVVANPYYQPGVVVMPAPVVVAPAPIVVMPTVQIGSIYFSLPSGARSVYINAVQYYVLNGVYYQPYFGNNGVYYKVVANPI